MRRETHILDDIKERMIEDWMIEDWMIEDWMIEERMIKRCTILKLEHRETDN